MHAIVHHATSQPYMHPASPRGAGSGSRRCCWRHRPFDLTLGRWVNAEAATDFTAAGVFGLLSSFDAVDATRAEVCSFGVFLVAMMDSYQVMRIEAADATAVTSARTGQVNNSI